MVGVITAFLMSGSTDLITTDTVLHITTNNATTYNATTNTMITWTNNTSTDSVTTSIILQNPMWVTFHVMIGFMIIVYIIVETLMILRNIR